jgi:hypothetical protein
MSRNYQQRLDGVTRALHEAAARDDQPAIERLSRLAAALNNAIATGTPLIIDQRADRQLSPSAKRSIRRKDRELTKRLEAEAAAAEHARKYPYINPDPKAAP